MKDNNESGYAIIIVLVLSAVLMIILSGAVVSLCAFSSQNHKIETELQNRASTLE